MKATSKPMSNCALGVAAPVPAEGALLTGVELASLAAAAESSIVVARAPALMPVVVGYARTDVIGRL
jgi:hypothetical protein